MKIGYTDYSPGLALAALRLNACLLSLPEGIVYCLGEFLIVLLISTNRENSTKAKRNKEPK